MFLTKAEVSSFEIASETNLRDVELYAVEKSKKAHEDALKEMKEAFHLKAVFMEKLKVEFGVLHLRKRALSWEGCDPEKRESLQASYLI